MQQLIRKDTDEVLVGYPPTYDTPTAAQIRVGTPAHAMGDSDSDYETATVEAVSATTNGVSKAGTTKLHFSSAPTVVVGRRYFLELATGLKFDVEVLGVDGNNVHLREPLQVECASGTAFKSYAVTFQLSAHQISEEGLSIARWRTNHSDNIYRVWDEPFVIVNVETNYDLSVSELIRTYPIVERLRPEEQTCEELIDVCWETYVRPDLEAKGIKVNQIKSWERVNPAHAAACVYHLVVTDERQDEMFREQWKTIYAHNMDLLFSSVRFWYDDNDGKTPGMSDRDFRQRTISR